MASGSQACGLIGRRVSLLVGWSVGRAEPGAGVAHVLHAICGSSRRQAHIIRGAGVSQTGVWTWLQSMGPGDR